MTRGAPIYMFLLTAGLSLPFGYQVDSREEWDWLQFCPGLSVNNGSFGIRVYRTTFGPAGEWKTNYTTSPGIPEFCILGGLAPPPIPWGGALQLYIEFVDSQTPITSTQMELSIVPWNN